MISVHGYLVHCLACGEGWIYVYGQHINCPHCGKWELCDVCGTVLDPVIDHTCPTEEDDRCT